VAFLFLGFYPKPALDLLNPAVSTTLQHVGVTDPAPTNAADGSAK
jgi:NADH-quinone oxidoreductase subunit M